MKMLRCLSGHILFNIGGELVSEILILRNGIAKYPRDDYNWGLYFRYRDDLSEVPERKLLTRDDIEGSKSSYSPGDQETIGELLVADEESIKLFCLHLMSFFCKKLDSDSVVINLRDVLEDSLYSYRIAKGAD